MTLDREDTFERGVERRGGDGEIGFILAAELG
jgi:hypothetical protein